MIMMNDPWINRFNKDVLPLIVTEFKPVKVMFFGSRVTGGASEDSDIDVIVISEAFKDIPFLKRMGKILKLTRFPKHVDYLCYTPEEFNNVKNNSIVIEDALENHLDAVY